MDKLTAVAFSMGQVQEDMYGSRFSLSPCTLDKTLVSSGTMWLKRVSM